MGTIVALAFLIVFGVVMNFVAVLVLNLAGLPGALAAGQPGTRSKARFVAGSLVAAAGQSYVYLAFTALVVNWTRLAAAREDVVGVALWLAAFICVALPVWMTLIRARLEARELEHANPQVEALHLTTLIALAGFFVFAFAPVVVRVAWPWVPYAP